MNYQEIEKLIEKVGGIGKVMGYPTLKNFPEFKKITPEYPEANVEGETVILHFTESDIYVKVEGYYSSFTGQRWEDFYEVRPIEKTITIYG